ncbi:MAG: hypothetical protein RL757_1675 [Bacteroidota bacterium]|jgi:hypothetical protein
MLRILILLLAFMGILACKDDKNASNTGGGVGIGKVTALTDRKLENRTIVPHFQFGDAPVNADEKLLKKIFGDSNIVRKNGESIIFKDSPQQMNVIWQAAQPFQRIEKVWTNQPNSAWRLRNGARVGDDVQLFLPENGVSIDTAQQRIIKIIVQMNH